MSEHQEEFSAEEGHSRKKREMSRRQFLAYTLGGASAFMAVGPLVPMLRFAVDPILQPKEEADWIKVVEVSKITDRPQRFKFEIHQIDGWYESYPELEVWITKNNQGEIFALSPVCKHLGCTVNWGADANQYICPCHDARYSLDGNNLTIASAPLDEYAVKVSEDGFVYVGQLGPNKQVKKK